MAGGHWFYPVLQVFLRRTVVNIAATARARCFSLLLLKCCCGTSLLGGMPK